MTFTRIFPNVNEKRTNHKPLGIASGNNGTPKPPESQWPLPRAFFTGCIVLNRQPFRAPINLRPLPLAWAEGGDRMSAPALIRGCNDAPDAHSNTVPPLVHDAADRRHRRRARSLGLAGLVHLAGLFPQPSRLGGNRHAMASEVGYVRRPIAASALYAMSVIDDWRPRLGPAIGGLTGDPHREPFCRSAIAPEGQARHPEPETTEWLRRMKSDNAGWIAGELRSPGYWQLIEVFFDGISRQAISGVRRR
jgi:hypothetical protein